MPSIACADVQPRVAQWKQTQSQSGATALIWTQPVLPSPKNINNRRCAHVFSAPQPLPWTGARGLFRPGLGHKHVQFDGWVSTLFDVRGTSCNMKPDTAQTVEAKNYLFTPMSWNLSFCAQSWHFQPLHCQCNVHVRIFGGSKVVSAWPHHITSSPMLRDVGEKCWTTCWMVSTMVDDVYWRQLISTDTPDQDWWWLIIAYRG